MFICSNAKCPVEYRFVLQFMWHLSGDIKVLYTYRTERSTVVKSICDYKNNSVKK